MRESYMRSVAKESGVRLDPRTKIFIMLMINISAFTMDAWYVLALAGAVPLSLFALSRRYLTAAVCALIYASALLADVFLVDALPGVANLIIVMLSGVVCRMMPALLLGYFLLNTTTVSEFVAAMERMHVPRQIIIPFSVMFRFFPTIREESSSINDAMRMRGISFGKTRGGPAALMEYRLVPLFISCVKIGEELSGSALTRGMGSPVKRTNICRIGFRAADVVYMAASAVVFSLFILL
ncbi:MAG: energy-coupling factor transporter transmembrane component T [Bacillota bacterium]